MHPQKALPSWAQHDLVKKIFASAVELDGEARIVGGAVRNWLVGKDVEDIDMAVNLPIEIIANKLREKKHIKIIETGLSHGTVTVASRKHKIQLTQTRNDTANDGRHAVVHFQGDWVKDASRRDFTINAIYLDSEGNIFDPFEGCVDLAERCLRFVGNAADRVQEDSLRMLRFCRFFMDYGSGKLDQSAMSALCKFAPLAKNLSGERVTQELRKILSNENCIVAIRMLNDCGLDKSALGCNLYSDKLSSDPACLAAVMADYDWLVVFAALLPEKGFSGVLQRLRLRRADQRFCKQLVTQSTIKHYAALTSKSWRQTAIFLQGYAASIYACAAWRNSQPFKLKHYHELQSWRPPEFPLSGEDLLSHGVDNGPLLGQMLKNAKHIWVRSNFTLNKSALLDKIIDS